jgi:transcriptional regulator with XRE-family HTH domain
MFSLSGMTLGARVRFYREYRGWTLEKLAELSSVDVGTISALENRKSRRSNFAQALATAFGLSIEQLTDESRNWLAPEGTPALAARQPEAPAYTPWPFPQVTVAEWERLGADDRAEVQGFVKALIARRKRRAA